MLLLLRSRASRCSLIAALALLTACGSGEPLGTGGHGTGGTGLVASSSSSSSSASSSSGTAGTGGAAPATLDQILAELRADRDAALASHAAASGWPAPVDGGLLFVSTDPAMTKVAGDHDSWAGTPLTPDDGFSWAVIAAPPNDHYKFTDGTDYTSDPWSRSVDYDQFGEISVALPTGARLDRHFGVSGGGLVPRTVRVWVPNGALDRVLYVHDGQNLFDPGAIWGGWHLQDTAPDGMLLVGIDNTAARMDEYTHVPDDIDGSGTLIGGKGDPYADFLQTTVRPLVKKHYGEPGPVGLMGSSLGGLISLSIAHRYPGEFAFAASLSGTMGWGSIGAEVHNETMIQRYQASGKQAPILYVDSGGAGTSCADSDGDGTDDDDPSASDNYCENAQIFATLKSIGYKDQLEVFYWHEPGAEHNEAAWAARVFRPLGIFAGL